MQSGAEVRSRVGLDLAVDAELGLIQRTVPKLRIDAKRVYVLLHPSCPNRRHRMLLYFNHADALSASGFYVYESAGLSSPTRIEHE